MAAPGSARKLRVLMERASRREPLFHPLDGMQQRGNRLPPPPSEELPPLAEGA